MTAAEALHERKRALLARCPDAVLLETVEVLGDPLFGSPERKAFVWACDELEQRHPTVVPALERVVRQRP